MSTEPTYPAEVANLRYGNLWSTPVTVSGWEHPTDDADDESGWRFIEAFTATDDDGREHVLVVENWRVVALVVDGDAYASHEYDAYADARTDDEGDPIEWAMSEAVFDGLFQVQPEAYGADGPMMNYWYPVDGVDFDAEDAAKLIDSSLCIVEVNGTVGLALTGGGMDMTWSILAAFVALGYLPPVHFARDIPGEAGRGKSESDRILIDAALRSLGAAEESLHRDRERLIVSRDRWASGE